MSSDLNPKRFYTQIYVRLSLISLYLALTFPIIFIALDNFKLLSILCLVFGLIFTYSISNDYVIINENSIILKTSFLSSIFGKNSREIFWNEIVSVKSYPTSQGSKVHYFITSSKKSFLVPQRLERYHEFKKILEKKINYPGIEDINYISPLWTYKILTLISTVMFFGELYGFVLR